MRLIVPVAVVLIYFFSAAHTQRKATYSSNGRLEFTPNKSVFGAWLLMIAYLAYAIATQLKHSRNALDWIGTLGLLAVGALIVAGFPGTIVITADGLEQVHWLWRNKHVQWSEIEEINTGEKSRAVTITATDGTKIVHSRQLPDRPRLLFELKQHCGENLPPDFPREPVTDL